MAVRASDRVTLAVLPSPSYVRTYYLKQSSTLNPPAVPTTNPPAAPWSTVEPTFTPNATETVYTVMLTAYGSVSFEYGPVQKSASFEAAKQAYNQAIAAGNSASDALTAAQKAQTDLANLQIGGRNLLTETSDEWQNLYLNSTTWYYQKGSDFAITPGETYTFSVVVEKVSEDSFPVNIHLGLGLPPGSYTWDMPSAWGGMYSNIPFGKRVSLTFTIPLEGGTFGDRVYFAFRLRNEKNPMHIRFRNVKLERGTKATDWTPAPEDVDAAIGAATVLANNAQLAANGKNVNTYSDVAESTLPANVPNPPSPANRINGDRHRVRTNTTYRILAEWELTNGAWVKVKYGGATLTDLDAGTITSGYVSTTVLKAQDVAAHVGSFISVNAEQVTAGKFKSDRLDTNEIWTNDLAARVGTFSRVVVASASNYRDPGLTDPLGFNTALSYLTHDPVGGYRGGGAFTVAGSSSPRTIYETFNASKPLSRVEAGKNLSVGVWIKSTAAIAPGTVGLATQFRTETADTGSAVYTHIDTSVPANTWTRLTVGLVAPADATRILIGLRSLPAHTGTVTYSDIELLPQISGTLIEPGGIKTNHLGIVPESGTGGLELLPPGLRILPPDNGEGGTTISLRNDEPAAISFSQGGEAKFSVSPEGDLTAKTVSVDRELLYRSVELTDILNQFPLGLVSEIGGITQNAPVQTTMRGLMTVNFTNNTNVTRVVKVTAKLHLRNRNDNLKVAFYGESSTTSEDVRATLSSVVRSETNYGVHLNGQDDIEHIQFFKHIPGQTWSVLVGIKTNNSTTEQQVFSDDNTRMWAEDLGPWREFDIQVPDLRGGVTDGTISKKTYTKSWNTTGHRTYSYTGLMSTRASQSLVQGYMAGANSRGHWFFNDADIRSNLSGAELVSGTLTITNQHSYSGSGMTAVVRSHGYSTAPGTFGSSNPWTSVHVPKGGSVSLPLTASLMSALASGSVRGFSLDHGGGTSSANYGYFSPTATLRLTYKK